MAALPLALAQKIELIMAVDEYVFGYCLHERNNHQPGDTGASPEMRAYVADLIGTGGYPHLSRLVDESADFETVWEVLDAAMRDAERFDRNLARLLDGFEREMGLRPR
ncbi:MAG: TetR/AcrR family transcriptional regulator C-terminal domain-containing protein [Actinobacteria bacterium]|nr:TetR/AcrR family transcriptional regulator C-terminal domain-containing protein [Actinomycetota bacterium]